MSTITLELTGKYNHATIFTDNIETTAVGQIIQLLNEPIAQNAKIAVMPDVHAGKGSTIGTTIKLPENRKEWRICPNITGVDLGCSMRAVKVDIQDVDLKKLDEVVNQKVPAGFNIHDKPIANIKQLDALFNRLSFPLTNEQRDRLYRSCGTLGGGNHYVEFGKSQEGYWLTVHSGSRNLGVLVAKHHQNIAENQDNQHQAVKDAIIHHLKANNQHHLIENELAQFSKTNQVPDYLSHQFQNIQPKATVKDLAYLTGNLVDDYLNDVEVAMEYSTISRKLMLQQIIDAMGWNIIDEFESMHNYIDTKNGIIRKGATSAQLGERLIIPLNMRDGAIFATGKGNPDWNYSAPHGAGRLLSRSAAKENIDLKDYQETMKGIYSSSVNASTLDESPFAYKNAQEIIDRIGDTVEINEIVKPLYNFKAH